MANLIGQLVGGLAITGLVTRLILKIIGTKTPKRNAAFMAFGIGLLTSIILTVISPNLGILQGIIYIVGLIFWLAFDLIKANK